MSVESLAFHRFVKCFRLYFTLLPLFFRSRLSHHLARDKESINIMNLMLAGDVNIVADNEEYDTTNKPGGNP